MTAGSTSADIGAGLRLLDLSAWISRGGGWQWLYRCLPHRLRVHVSAYLTARVQERLRFPRTPAWRNALPDASRATAIREGAALDAVGIPGVNLIGFIRGEFGLGENARAYAHAMIDAGIPISLCDVDVGLSHGCDDHSLDALISEKLPYSVSLVFVNPDVWRLVMDKISGLHTRSHYVIACWFWELERVPDQWISTIAEVDEIMVTTGFVEQAFRQVTDKPIMRIPHPLRESAGSGLQRKDFGLSDEKFMFMASFDFNSFIARKNPFSVIEAFDKAFESERRDVQLLIKTSNGFRHLEALRQLLAAVKGDERIVVRDDVIDRAHLNALQRCCDVYVSLHRSEGLGLGLAECMALGKPVIATNWSGNLEFMDAGSAALVNSTMVPTMAGSYPDSEGQRWAEPDTEDAARWMRRLADDRDFARELGERGRKHALSILSPEAAMRKLCVRLRQIGEGGKAAAVSQPMQEATPRRVK